jgi:hypothetical protein
MGRGSRWPVWLVTGLLTWIRFDRTSGEESEPRVEAVHPPAWPAVEGPGVSDVTSQLAGVVPGTSFRSG